MRPDRIRVGLVGASVSRGWAMQAHIPALAALPDFELAAVCTTRQESADASAKAFGASLAFADYREMVLHPGVDVVTVTVRAPWHKEIVLAAAAAGKHVYCEWPLTITAADADEMVAAADAAGVKHIVGLQGRTAPWVLYLKELLADGYVGRVLTAHASLFMPDYRRTALMANTARRERGSHVLSIQSGHLLDIICNCLGEFEEVSAEVRTLTPQWHLPETGETVDVDAPDSVMVQGRLAGGAWLSAQFAYAQHHGSGWRLEIYGDEGAIVVSLPTVGHVRTNRMMGGRSGEKELHELQVPDRFFHVQLADPDSAGLHVAEVYRNLGIAIREGAKAYPGFEIAAARHRLLESLELSTAEGRRVRPK